MGEETGHPTSQAAEDELRSDSLLLVPRPPSWVLLHDRSPTVSSSRRLKALVEIRPLLSNSHMTLGTSPVHSFHKYPLGSHSVPGSVLGPKDPALRKLSV